jgi:chemotaxis protein CheZ
VTRKIAMSTPIVDADVDLEALFDRIAADRSAACATAAAETAAADVAPCAPSRLGAGVADVRRGGNAHVFRRLGHLTRSLHEALQEVGYDHKLASVASTMPDTRKRLEYIASLTGRSAETVLEGVERAQALQQSIDVTAAGLNVRWQALHDGALTPAEFKALAADTRGFLVGVHEKTGATRTCLHEMMMAQDFHDLTGQVIKKIVDVAHKVETSLVELLLEAMPADTAFTGFLNGPLTGADAGADSVASQAQVDQLLDSLGF